jgi:polysaccharide export outer membrane protein
MLRAIGALVMAVAMIVPLQAVGMSAGPRGSSQSGSSARSAPPPAQVEREATASSTPDDATPAVSAVTPDYIIGPGDTLQVFVWRNPELTVTLPVRPDGKISTPLVEDMVAVGKTPSVLARDVEKVLAEFVRSPQVNVIVMKPANAFSQVKVTGQVKNPQSLPFREGMTVLDALLEAGGMTDFAAGNRAKIVRMVKDKTQEIAVKLNKLEDGDMTQNIALRPGDILLVPQTRF